MISDSSFKHKREKAEEKRGKGVLPSFQLLLLLPLLLLLLSLLLLLLLHQHSSSLINMNFTAFLVAARLRRAIARSNLRTEYWQTDRAVIRSNKEYR